jgi:hypothetical protein
LFRLGAFTLCTHSLFGLDLFSVQPFRGFRLLPFSFQLQSSLFGLGLLPAQFLNSFGF